VVFVPASLLFANSSIYKLFIVDEIFLIEKATRMDSCGSLF